MRGHAHPEDSRRYQSDRDIADAGPATAKTKSSPFASENRLTASPTGSVRAGDGSTEEQNIGERNRSRTSETWQWTAENMQEVWGTFNRTVCARTWWHIPLGLL